MFLAMIVVFIMTSLAEQIALFLAGAPHAVVGASSSRHKYGNKVLRCYQQAGRTAYAINPYAKSIESSPTFARLADVPETVHGISIITPPHVTEMIIPEALELGISNIWLQPGADNKAALRMARDAGANLIARGPCILVVLGFKDR